MSAPSKLGNRGERNRGKFRASDVGNTFKGSGSTQQKSSAGRHQHGAQTLRKVVRRMPPPVNLPSLKSENARIGLDPSNIVTAESTVCFQGGRVTDTGCGSNSFFSSYEHSAQNSNGNNGPVIQADYGHQVKRAGVLADQKLKRFQEDFPQLPSAVEGNAAASKAEEKRVQSSYGPGPSLRPQNVSTWREGGGRGILQTSPPSTPLNQPSPVTVAGSTSTVSDSLPAQSAPINANAGMPHDVQKPLVNDDGVLIVTPPTEGRTSVLSSVPPLAIRPGVQPGPNGLMAFQAPLVPSCYQGMMIPSFGFSHGYGHPYSAGFMYPVIPRMPMMNTVKAGFHSEDSTYGLQPKSDRAYLSSSDSVDADVEAFSRLTLSSPRTDDVSRKRMNSKAGHMSGASSNTEFSPPPVEAEEILGREHEYHRNMMAEASDGDEGTSHKNQASIRNGGKPKCAVSRSYSNSEDSEFQQSRQASYHDLAPQRSISNPGDSEELEDDSWRQRRRQQSELMSAAVERARKRREEEERQIQERRMNAAKEKLRQLEEKFGKKPVRETKDNKLDDNYSTASDSSKQHERDQSVGDNVVIKSKKHLSATDVAEDVKRTELASPPATATNTAGPSSIAGGGYYLRHPYVTHPDHLHRLPSPKCWSVTAGNARMPFPQFPVDPYMYWRHLVESGAWPCYPNMRMPFNPNVHDVRTSKAGSASNPVSDSEHGTPGYCDAEAVGKNDKRKLSGDSISVVPTTREEKYNRLDDCNMFSDCSLDSRAWNAFSSHWAQPSWMKGKTDGIRAGQPSVSAKQFRPNPGECSNSASSEDHSTVSGEKSSVASSGSTRQGGMRDPNGAAKYAGMEADFNAQQMYYQGLQAWWNFSQAQKMGDMDSHYMLQENMSSSNGTIESMPKSSTTPEKYSNADTTKSGNSDKSDSCDSSIRADIFQTKSGTQKQNARIKSSDFFDDEKNLGALQNEDQPYSPYRSKDTSGGGDPSSSGGFVASINQKTKFDRRSVPANEHRNEQMGARNSPAYVAFSSSGAANRYAKSTETLPEYENDRMSRKKAHSQLANAENSRGNSYKPSSGSPKLGQLKGDASMVDFDEDSFWSSGNDTANGFVETLSMSKRARHLPTFK